jgi:hypothetical protein
VCFEGVDDSGVVEDADHGILECACQNVSVRYYSEIGYALPIGGDLSFCLELNLVGDLATVEIEFDQEVVVYVAGEEAPLMDGDRGRDVFLFGMFRLVDIRVPVFCRNGGFVEVEGKGSDGHF